MSQTVTNKFLNLIQGYCRSESNDMNIVDGIITIIFEYYRFAIWSKKYKGDGIKLSEDDTKATCIDIQKQSRAVRADFSIDRGEIVSWEFESYQSAENAYFYGVISSKEESLNGSPGFGTLENCYGIDDYTNMIYLGSTQVNSLTSSDVNPNWEKPKLPSKEAFILKVIADWREKQCKLTFFWKEKKLNDTNEEYTLLLPELDDEYVWYPCMTPFNTNAYCIIRYAI